MNSSVQVLSPFGPNNGSSVKAGILNKFHRVSRDGPAIQSVINSRVNSAALCVRRVNLSSV